MIVKGKPYYDLMLIMKRKRITQTQLSDAIGINRSSLNAKLNGRVALNFEEAIAISDYLNVPLEDIN